MPAKKRFVRGHFYKLTKRASFPTTLRWDGATTPEEERECMVAEFVRMHNRSGRIPIYYFRILSYFNRVPIQHHKFGITRDTLERAWSVEEIPSENLPLYFGPSVTPYFEDAIKRANGAVKRKVRGKPKPRFVKEL